MEVVASLSQGRTAAAQCGLFTHKSVPVIFEPPCTYCFPTSTTVARYMYIPCVITTETECVHYAVRTESFNSLSKCIKSLITHHKHVTCLSNIFRG